MKCGESVIPKWNDDRGRCLDFVVAEDQRSPGSALEQGAFYGGFIADGAGERCAIRELDEGFAAVYVILVHLEGFNGLARNLGTFHIISRHVYLL
jgi:hypothetical protein